jgi:hypothetical protein
VRRLRRVRIRTGGHRGGGGRRRGSGNLLLAAGALAGIAAVGGGHAGPGGIPAGYQAAYVHAAQATCLGGNWEILAGIGKIESSQGQNMGPSAAGAIGPMQFEPATFAAVRHRHPDVGANVYSIHGGLCKTEFEEV